MLNVVNVGISPKPPLHLFPSGPAGITCKKSSNITGNPAQDPAFDESIRSLDQNINT